MSVINFLLLLAGFIAFALAACSVPTRRLNLIGLGLALWILVPLIAAFPH